MMRRFVTALTVVVVVVLLEKILFFSLDFFYRRVYVGQDGGDLNQYLADPKTPDLVIMGASTARFQVNPDSFSVRSCNMGHSLTTECYQLGLLNVMIKNKRIPKNILLSLWPLNYLDTKNTETQPEDILYLKYYYKQSEFIRNEINRISPLERYKYWFDCYRFNGEVVNTLKYYYLSRQHVPGTYSFAYEQTTPNDSANTQFALRLRKEHLLKEPPLQLVSYKSKYLKQFIDTCRKYNVNLMCYWFGQLAEDTVRLKSGIDFIEQQMASKNIPYYRFRTDSTASLFKSPGLWTAGEHLNARGAAIESKILADFVKPLLK